METWLLCLMLEVIGHRQKIDTSFYLYGMPLGDINKVEISFYKVHTFKLFI